MLVKQLMTSDVGSCSSHDTMTRAAEVMWERDCGCVPVVDLDNRLVGMITDRDVCMAAYMEGRPLTEIPVGSAMSTNLHTCRAADSVTTAETRMKESQVRRLPVVDEEHRVIGVLSLNDIAREAVGKKRGKPGVTDPEVAETLAAVGRRRPPVQMV